MPQPRYEIQFQPTPQAPPTPLQATTDANEATVAFHAQLRRLRECGEVGHVLLHKLNGERELLLRQPVAPRTMAGEGS